jgi:hypothetical protein
LRRVKSEILLHIKKTPQLVLARNIAVEVRSRKSYYSLCREP